MRDSKREFTAQQILSIFAEFPQDAWLITAEDTLFHRDFPSLAHHKDGSFTPDIKTVGDLKYEPEIAEDFRRAAKNAGAFHVVSFYDPADKSLAAIGAFAGQSSSPIKVSWSGLHHDLLLVAHNDFTELQPDIKAIEFRLAGRKISVSVKPMPMIEVNADDKKVRGVGPRIANTLRRYHSDLYMPDESKRDALIQRIQRALQPTRAP